MGSLRSRRSTRREGHGYVCEAGRFSIVTQITQKSQIKVKNWRITIIQILKELKCCEDNNIIGKKALFLQKKKKIKV